MTGRRNSKVGRPRIGDTKLNVITVPSLLYLKMMAYAKKNDITLPEFRRKCYRFFLNRVSEKE